MFLYINRIALIIFTLFFFIKCENDVVNLDSGDISTTLEVSTFNIDSELSYSYHFSSLDSLIRTSPRLYAFSYPEARMILNLNISKIHENEACLSDSLSLIRFELSSLNQLIEKDIDEDDENNEIISEIYIDTSGVQISGNNIPLNFKIEEYDIIIDSLNNQISDFCSLDNLEFIITYENNLDDEDIRDCIEIFSSDYTFEPSQPKLNVYYNVLEEESISDDKYNINSIQTDESFGAYIVSNEDSNQNGEVFLVNYDGDDNEIIDGVIDSVMVLDTMNLINPIISNTPFEFNVKINFSLIQDPDQILPIQFYLDSFLAYSDLLDPQMDNWNDCGTDGICSESNPDEDNTENNGVWDLGEAYEGNNVLDWNDENENGHYDYEELLIEQYDDTGFDGCFDLFEDGEGGCLSEENQNYNPLGSENNQAYNIGEFFNDFGEDGCFDSFEDGDGGCLSEENPDYDEIDNPDPNGDNYLEDINGDNWSDCGTDGVCSDSDPDEDGTENNGIWDLGEKFESNNQIDWIDSNTNLIVDIEDENYEPWYDHGADNIQDSLEFLEQENYLTSNIIHDISSYVEYNGEIFEVESVSNSIDSLKDANIWISNIAYDANSDSHQATINFLVNNPVKAIQFDFSHFPYIFTDSVYNENINIFYGGASDTLVNDFSIYQYETLLEDELQNIYLDYSQGIETSMQFDFLSDFIDSDSTLSVNTEYSNLFLYLNDRDDFQEGFSDIYYSVEGEDIFLKRVYFDDDNYVAIPIGGLIQKFIDRTLEYNGINLRLSGGGYNFNRLNFHKYGENNWDSCGSAGCSDSLNPKIEIMYSR